MEKAKQETISEEISKVFVTLNQIEEHLNFPGPDKAIEGGMAQNKVLEKISNLKDINERLEKINQIVSYVG